MDNFAEMKIPIVEIFNSISGEGITAGEITTFVRVAGCNRRCNYCDTKYSYNEYDSDMKQMSFKEIAKEVMALGCNNIICTGGEPLELNKQKRDLPLYLASLGLKVRIETNGSCPLYSYQEIGNYLNNERDDCLFYVMDIKCPGSGMDEFNIYKENFELLVEGDEIKFVVGSKSDFEFSLAILYKYKDILTNSNVVINFSPVFDKLEANELVEMLKLQNGFFVKNKLKVRMSLQIHKFIWGVETRGV